VKHFDLFNLGRTTVFVSAGAYYATDGKETMTAFLVGCFLYCILESILRELRKITKALEEIEIVDS